MMARHAVSLTLALEPLAKALQFDLSLTPQSRGQETAQREITTAIEEYKFNEAAGAAYRFVWNVYCDWYLELVKPVLMGPDSAAKTETRAMVAWVRDEILKLLHPFMPFITEELWGVTAARPALLALSKWPTAPR